jgi:hypothetical protein
LLSLLRVLADIRAPFTGTPDPPTPSAGAESSVDHPAGTPVAHGAMDSMGSMIMRKGHPVAEATLDGDLQVIERMLAEQESGGSEQHLGAMQPQRPGTRSSSSQVRTDQHSQSHAAGGHADESDQVLTLDPHPPIGAVRGSSASKGRLRQWSPTHSAAQQAMPLAHQSNSGTGSHHQHSQQHTHASSLGHTGEATYRNQVCCTPIEKRVVR